MFEMIKKPEQLIAAAEVLKVAEKLREEKWKNDSAANPQLHPVVWSEQNDPFKFVDQAYRNLIAVAARIQAAQGKDDAEASMRSIDAIVNKPTA